MIVNCTRYFLCAVAAGLSLSAPMTTAKAQEAFVHISEQGSIPTTTLLIRSTTDIEILRPALEAFVEENSEIAITYEQWGSNALYANSLTACEGEGASSDVVFSSGVHQMIDLVNRACATPYISDITEQLPAQRIWRDELWGVTLEPAVIIYNKALVAGDEVPRTRFALLDMMRRPTSRYQGKIATYDVEASGLGYLFAFKDSLEATTFGALLEGFARTDAVATCCSAEIIQGVADGRFLIAYNVLGSYVDTVAPKDIGVVLPEDYTLFLSRAYMIPKSAKHKDEAGAFLDFLLSDMGQSILARSNLVLRPDNDVNPLPESARRTIAIEPSLLVAIDQHRRARFVKQWRSTFGQQALE